MTCNEKLLWKLKRKPTTEEIETGVKNLIAFFSKLSESETKELAANLGYVKEV